VSPTRKRIVLILLLVGLVSLPGPAYAYGFTELTDPDPARASVGYVATPIDVTNDSLVADRFADEVAFQPGELSHEDAREDYDAPNATRERLVRAIETGSAPVENASVRRDLRSLDREAALLTHESDAYYTVHLDGSVLRAERADESVVAAAVRTRLVVPAADLPAGERATFEKIRNATSHDESYHPLHDERVPDGEIVTRDGQAYHVRATFPFDPGFIVGVGVGVIGSVLGALSLLLCLGVVLEGYLVD
jgi:hypothetical protein